MREIKLTVDEAKRLISANFYGHEDFRYELDLDTNRFIIHDETDSYRNSDSIMYVSFKTREMVPLIDHQQDTKIKVSKESDLEQESSLRKFVSNVVI